MISRAALIAVSLLAPAGAEDARHEFQFLAGYSPASSTVLGSTTDRRFVLAGFSYGYRFWESRSVSVSYTGALLPAAILLQPDQAGRGAHAVYGFGMEPIGFTFEFARKRRFHPFTTTMLGVIASTEPIPIYAPDASGLNFLVDLGGGVRWNAGRGRALSLGYRFLHISNASTTRFNPGVDNNVIYVGYSFLR